MATALDVTPAGNRLFEVDITEDTPGDGPKSERGASRTIEVGVPDVIADLVADKDVSLQDVVREAVQFVLDRDALEDLPASLDLATVAERNPGFVETVVAGAQARASSGAPPTGTHTTDRDTTDADDRLVSETRREQQEGQASQGPERY